MDSIKTYSSRQTEQKHTCAARKRPLYHGKENNPPETTVKKPRITPLEETHPRNRFESFGLHSSAQFPKLAQETYRNSDLKIDVKLQASDNTQTGHQYEDGACVFKKDDDVFIMLCDGVSGSNSKKPPLYVQSLLEAMQEYISLSPPLQFSEIKIKEILFDAMEAANEKVELSENYPSTTFSLLRIKGSNLDYFILGDSGFLFETNNKTHDHTQGCSMPQITLQEFMLNKTDTPFRIVPCPNQIIAYQNAEELNHTSVSIGSITISETSRLIVASDGLWDNTTIQNVLSQNKLIPHSTQKESFIEFWKQTFMGWENDIKRNINSNTYSQDKIRNLFSRFNVLKSNLLDSIYNANFGQTKPDDTTIIEVTINPQKAISITDTKHTTPQTMSTY